MFTTRRSLLAVGALTLLASLAGPSPSATAPVGDIDVYVLYSAKAKSEKVILVEAIDKDLKVKDYNVDLLKLSDYSGKQKAVVKIDRARIVVLLGEGTVKILKGTKFKSDMILVSDGTRKVRSTAWNLNVVAKGTDTSKLPDQKRHLEIGSVEDLQASDEDVLESGAIVVEDADKNLYPVVGALISSRLDS